MEKENIFNDISISSRIPHLTDKKAIDLWNFLKDYVRETKDTEGDTHLIISAFRVLDALSMINQDKIGYCEG